jgi:hypothetical protein
MSIECNDIALFKRILQDLQETHSSIHSLQKAIAAFREQFQDFRVGTQEDDAELQRKLWEMQFLHRERA